MHYGFGCMSQGGNKMNKMKAVRITRHLQIHKQDRELYSPLS